MAATLPPALPPDAPPALVEFVEGRARRGDAEVGEALVAAVSERGASRHAAARHDVRARSAGIRPHPREVGSCVGSARRPRRQRRRARDGQLGSAELPRAARPDRRLGREPECPPARHRAPARACRGAGTTSSSFALVLDDQVPRLEAAARPRARGARRGLGRSHCHRPVHRHDTGRAGVQAAGCARHRGRHRSLRRGVQPLLHRDRSRRRRHAHPRSRARSARSAARPRGVLHRDVLPAEPLLHAGERSPHRRDPRRDRHRPRGHSRSSLCSSRA